MDRLEIIKAPNPILTSQAELVTEFNKELEKFIEQMYYTMIGVTWGTPAGLAAPQVGKSLRLFIAFPQEPKAFINPTIRLSNGTNRFDEGCYSLEANKFFPVWRSQTVRIKFQDETGQWFEEKYNGERAEILQHEYDHLQGVLVTDRSKIQGYKVE